MKKIVLITTGQPATNPRIVKEADALAEAGYDVTVLYCYYIQWASDVEKHFLPTKRWVYKRVGGGPDKQKLLYFFTRLRFKIAGLASRYLGSGVLAEYAQARAYVELLKAAKRERADLYIGHNLGALAVAVKAAAHHGAKAGFDFEDYHRGEFLDGDKTASRIAFLENNYIDKLDYISSSSPEILAAVCADHPYFQGRRIVLLNAFPLSEQPPVVMSNAGENKLRLVWFSQTIGRNRGLETVFAAMDILKDPNIELTLAGRCDKEMKAYLLQTHPELQSSIHFAGIIPSADLPTFCATFDVGLALEMTQPLNRDLCLTNKLFTYLLASNAILASDTSAQRAFLENHNNIGLLFCHATPRTLAEQISRYKTDHNLLRQHRANSFQLAVRRYNWESESKKLVAECESLLN